MSLCISSLTPTHWTWTGHELKREPDNITPTVPPLDTRREKDERTTQEHLASNSIKPPADPNRHPRCHPKTGPEQERRTFVTALCDGTHNRQYGPTHLSVLLESGLSSFSFVMCVPKTSPAHVVVMFTNDSTVHFPFLTSHSTSNQKHWVYTPCVYTLST